MTNAYKYGIDRCVLYSGLHAESWSGVVSISEDSDSTTADNYLDGVRIAASVSHELFRGTIECFTYPESVQNGSKLFGMSWREKTETSYLIHLAYGLKISRGKFLAQQVDHENFFFSFASTPQKVPNAKHSAHAIVDPVTTDPAILSQLETMLFGENPELPSLDYLYSIFETAALLIVTDNGDGTFVVTGPNSAITMLDATTFQITWPSADPVDADTYTIYTY